MSNENIFSVLAKYSSANEENYLTESFVFVINSLLARERPVGLEILTQLCVKDNKFSFNIGEDISVSTQETTEQGRPDIKVSSPDKLIYIEVKDYSTLGYKQLERYKRDLEPSTAKFKHVVLLTRFAVDFEEEEQPYKDVRWYEVYNWLANTRTRVTDPISIYLIDSFNSFLEVKQMSIQKVRWEYINGVPALNNLINMIEVAIQGASLHTSSGGSGREFRGFNFEKGKFWCGVSYSNPLVVLFDIYDKQNFNAKLVEKSGYPMEENKDSITLRLRLEDKHFFSLDKDKQLEEITKFIKTAYGEAQKMRIP